MPLTPTRVHPFGVFLKSQGGHIPVVALKTVHGLRVVGVHIINAYLRVPGSSNLRLIRRYFQLIHLRGK